MTVLSRGGVGPLLLLALVGAAVVALVVGRRVLCCLLATITIFVTFKTTGPTINNIKEKKYQ